VEPLRGRMEEGGLGGRWSSLVLRGGSPPAVPLSSSASPALGGGGRWLGRCFGGLGLDLVHRGGGPGRRGRRRPCGGRRPWRAIFLFLAAWAAWRWRLKVAVAQGLLAGPSSRSQGEDLSLLALFFPLLDLGRGSPARRFRWLGRRVGAGDMVPGETLGRLCCPRRGRRYQRRSPSRRPRLRYLLPLTTTPLLGEIPWFPLRTTAALRRRSPS
jgi:hypothetical protein